MAVGLVLLSRPGNPGAEHYYHQLSKDTVMVSSFKVMIWSLTIHVKLK